MDDVAWAALTLSLTVLGAVWTWLSFRRRGLSSGLRALAFTLLPVAAYLTKTLQMFTRIVDAITTWATNLVFNPFVWLGVVLAGVSAALFVASSALRAREIRKSGHQAPRRELEKGGSRRGTPILGDDQDDSMAEIEALLRKRGIT